MPIPNRSNLAVESAPFSPELKKGDIVIMSVSEHLGGRDNPREGQKVLLLSRIIYKGPQAGESEDIYWTGQDAGTGDSEPFYLNLSDIVYRVKGILQEDGSIKAIPKSNNVWEWSCDTSGYTPCGYHVTGHTGPKYYFEVEAQIIDGSLAIQVPAYPRKGVTYELRLKPDGPARELEDATRTATDPWLIWPSDILNEFKEFIAVELIIKSNKNVEIRKEQGLIWLKDIKKQSES